MYQLLNFVPKNHLSFVLGRLAHVNLPAPLARMLVRSFANAFNLNMEEATKPIEQYRSIGDLFIRDLRPELRPIAEGIVSPIDGTLRSFGEVNGGVIPQVKDRSYTVQELLVDPTWASQFQESIYFNLYLSPKDYHHVHVPFDGSIIASTYIPGKLWPVNDWSLNSINKLFAINERLVTYIETSKGLMALVMVGATNVGKITVSYDDWVTNSLSSLPKNFSTRQYQRSIEIRKGQRLGTFHLGSSVVLLVPRNSFEHEISGISHVLKPVKYGQMLID